MPSDQNKSASLSEQGSVTTCFFFLFVFFPSAFLRRSRTTTAGRAGSSFQRVARGLGAIPDPGSEEHFSTRGGSNLQTSGGSFARLSCSGVVWGHGEAAFPHLGKKSKTKIHFKLYLWVTTRWVIFTKELTFDFIKNIITL